MFRHQSPFNLPCTIGYRYRNKIARTFTLTHALVFTSKLAYSYTHSQIHTHTHSSTYMHTHSYIHVCKHSFTRKCINKIHMRSRQKYKHTVINNVQHKTLLPYNNEKQY